MDWGERYQDVARLALTASAVRELLPTRLLTPVPQLPAAKNPQNFVLIELKVNDERTTFVGQRVTECRLASLPPLPRQRQKFKTDFPVVYFTVESGKMYSISFSRKENTWRLRNDEGKEAVKLTHDQMSKLTLTVDQSFSEITKDPSFVKKIVIHRWKLPPNGIEINKKFKIPKGLR